MSAFAEMLKDALVNERRRPTKLALGLVGLLVCGGLFLLLFERVETTRQAPPSAAARRNHLLAAEILLERLGLPARGVRAPFRLPPTDHVVVLAPERFLADYGWHGRLLDWVREGGHLITGPRVGTSMSDILQVLGADVDRRRGSGEPELLELEAASGGPTFRVEMAYPLRLTPGHSEPEMIVGDRVGGVEVLRYRRGQGTVTLLADPGFFDNSRIGKHEHASYLWQLVNTPSRPAAVWLVYHDAVPNLGRLLRERAGIVLVALAAWILAWIFLRGTRFGPLLPPPETDRRDLGEHLAASGSFLYRHGQAGALIGGVRQAVLRQAASKHPEWSRLAGAAGRLNREQAEFLAEHTGLAPNTVARAFNESFDDSEAWFTRTVITLERIRNGL